MKQRSWKLAGLCITAALIVTVNTTTAVARESKDQVVEKEQVIKKDKEKCPFETYFVHVILPHVY